MPRQTTRSAAPASPARGAATTPRAIATAFQLDLAGNGYFRGQDFKAPGWDAAARGVAAPSDPVVTAGTTTVDADCWGTDPFAGQSWTAGSGGAAWANRELRQGREDREPTGGPADGRASAAPPGEPRPVSVSGCAGGTTLSGSMRILFVHDVLGDRGGAEANIRHQASGLRRRGDALALLHGARTGTGEPAFDELFADRFDWTARTDALTRALAWKPDLVYVHKLARRDVLQGLVRSGRPLVRMVHDHDLWCQRTYRYFPWNRRICTRRAGWGCALTCGVLRARGSRLPVKLAWPGDKLAELELCRRFDAHVVISRFMRREMELHGFDSARLHIVPPAPRAASPSHEAAYAEPLAVFVGQVIRGKGVDVLLRALRRLRTPGWRALVIGDGSHRDCCERLCRALGLAERVRFTGWIPQAQLHEHFRRARAGVVPSVWPEPLGNVGIELMHHALPVVGFDAGGISDWLKDGETGHLVPLWDLDAFAAKLDLLLSDAEASRRMGGQALRIAKAQWDHERNLDDLRALLTATAERRP